MLRKLKRWEIKNHSLYNLMQQRNLRIIDVANMVEVNRRTVLRWLFEGATPVPENRKRIEKALGCEGLF